MQRHILNAFMREINLEMKQVFEVSFVCLGNICRSPLAQGVFESLVAREGLGDQILTSSAGVSGWHTGQPPDARMRETARQKGIQINSRARQFKPADLDRSDLVLAMDQTNLSALEQMGGASDKKLRLFRSFDPMNNGDLDVPDPYYGGNQGFEYVYHIVARTCPKILEFIRPRLAPLK